MYPVAPVIKTLMLHHLHLKITIILEESYCRRTEPCLLVAAAASILLIFESRSKDGIMLIPSIPKKFGVLGSGEVGQVLAKGLVGLGQEVRIGTRTPGKLAKFSKATGIREGNFAEVAAWAEAAVLAVL